MTMDTSSSSNHTESDNLVLIQQQLDKLASDQNCMQLTINTQSAKIENLTKEKTEVKREMQQMKEDAEKEKEQWRKENIELKAYVTDLHEKHEKDREEWRRKEQSMNDEIKNLREEIGRVSETAAVRIEELEFKNKATLFILNHIGLDPTASRNCINMLHNDPSILRRLRPLEELPCSQKVNGYHEVFETGLTGPSAPTPSQGRWDKFAVFMQNLPYTMVKYWKEILVGVIVVCAYAGTGYVIYTYGSAVFNAFTISFVDFYHMASSYIYDIWPEKDAIKKEVLEAIDRLVKYFIPVRSLR